MTEVSNVLYVILTGVIPAASSQLVEKLEVRRFGVCPRGKDNHRKLHLASPTLPLRRRRTVLRRRTALRRTALRRRTAQEEDSPEEEEGGPDEGSRDEGDAQAGGS